MTTVAKTLYDADFAEWTALTAELLRQERLNEVDLPHLVEEIPDHRPWMLADLPGDRRNSLHF